LTSTPPKVLFVTSNRIGDCVISSGVIREIGRQMPGAQITVAVGRPPAPFFRSAPGVERVIVLDKKKAAGHWFDLWKQVAGTRWDWVIDIRGSALAWLLPTRRRTVYTRRWETGLRKVQMVSALMGSPTPLDPEIFLDDPARAEAAAPAWAALDPTERAAVALEILDALQQRAFEMAFACMHACGQPFAMAFQAGTAHALDRALEAVAIAMREMGAYPARVLWEKPDARRPLRVEKTFEILPRGIAAVIGCATFPTWNSYPGLFASLVTGNPVVVKPHPTAVLPLALCVDTARTVLAGLGLDADVVQLLVDTRAAPKTKALALDARVKLIDFTGGPEFGDWLESHARQAHVFTEKAGVNAVLIEGTGDYPGLVRNLALTLSLSKRVEADLASTNSA